MTYAEIEEVLGGILAAESGQLAGPSQDDWSRLESRFACTFSSEFKDFIELMGRYCFPGEILNVSSATTNGNSQIVDVYAFELQHGRWSASMIPFYAIGNGDYFCLNRTECPSSAVYYYYHDRDEYVADKDSMGDWIRHLPQFLA